MEKKNNIPKEEATPVKEKLRATKITEYMICRKDRYLCFSEVKHIRSIFGKEIFDKYLRVEKLAETIYTIRFKKDVLIGEAMVIRKYVEGNRNPYRIWARKKDYNQIRKEQEKVSKEKIELYKKKRELWETQLKNELLEGRLYTLQQLAKEN